MGLRQVATPTLPRLRSMVSTATEAALARRPCSTTRDTRHQVFIRFRLQCAPMGQSASPPFCGPYPGSHPGGPYPPGPAASTPVGWAAVDLAPPGGAPVRGGLPVSTGWFDIHTNTVQATTATGALQVVDSTPPHRFLPWLWQPARAQGAGGGGPGRPGQGWLDLHSPALALFGTSFVEVSKAAVAKAARVVSQNRALLTPPLTVDTGRTYPGSFLANPSDGAV